MSSLLDNIDRLTAHSKQLVSTSNGILANPIAGPFTRAVLHTPLERLIRDVDPSELGLFTLRDDARSSRSAVGEKDVERVAFAGATPLKKRTALGKEREQPETEPEVYARAALKYLDRFEAVRPMPRARSQAVAILEELAKARERVAELALELEQLASQEPLLSPKSAMKAEEKRIAEVKGRMEVLRTRREAALQAQKHQTKPLLKTPRKLPHTEAPPADPSPFVAPTFKKRLPHETPPRVSSSKFWTTPAPIGKALRYSAVGVGGSLLDESMAIGDMSVVSECGSEEVSTVKTTRERIGLDVTAEDVVEDESRDEDQDGDEEKTVMFSKPSAESFPSPPATPPRPPPLPAAPPEEDVVLLPPATPTVSSSTDSPAKKTQRRIKITSEVERICARVWATVGEIIMPGNKNGGRPPKAKETIAHLQSLAQTVITPSLPSSPVSMSSLSTTTTSAPTAQAVSIAHLILCLLSSRTGSHRALLKEVKDVLVKTGGQAAGRVVYACVAKRLVRIDRGGGEQVVVFDY